MPIGTPATASPRADLTFLRHRARPRSTAAPAPAAGSIDYTHHSTAKAAPSAAPAASAAPVAPAAPAGRPTIDFSRPDRRSAAAAQPSVAGSPAVQPPVVRSAPASGRVDFHRDRPPPAGSLDLSETPAPGPAARRPAPEPLPRYRGPRVTAGQQLLLGPGTPTATLTRVQSGVGRLTVQAICSPEIGDLRLGALYALRSGGTSTVQLAGGNRFAPSSRRPVILASREEYEQLAVDLRQIRDIERLTVYAFSESRTPLTWGGTLVVTTFGGARIEMPLESLAPARLAVLVSFYNLNGELVVRTEFETIDGDVREAARAFGYDRITWRDDRSPVD